MKSPSFLTASLFAAELAGCSIPVPSSEHLATPSSAQASKFDCKNSLQKFAPLIRARLGDAGMVEMVNESGPYRVAGPYQEGTPHGYWFPEGSIPTLAAEISTSTQHACEKALNSSDRWSDAETEKAIDEQIGMQIAKACKKDKANCTSPVER